MRKQAKAIPKKKAAPPPPPRVTKVKSATGRDAEVDAAIEALFKLCDRDGSGSIEFREFMDHHTNIMSASDMGGPTQLQMSACETKFREHDKDNSHTLELNEFRSYMDGVHAVLGKRKFLDVCSAVTEETSKKIEQEKSSFDRNASERLLEKVRGANRMLPDIVTAALQLLEKKADPNVTDATGTHTLLYATDKSEDDFIRVLLEHGANPKLHNKDQDCMAFRAARARKLNILRMAFGLEQAPASSDHDMEDRRQTSKDFIRNMSSLEFAQAQAMFKKGIDVNHRDSSGWTPLTASVFWGKAEIVDMLLKAQGMHKNGGKVRLNVPNGRGRPALHIAARKGRTAILDTLVRHRCDLDMQDTDGWTALHHAVFNGENECALILVRGGANPAIQGLHGLTPYMLTNLPASSTRMKEETIKALQPPECLSYGSALAPILKNESKTVSEMLEAILTLPGANNVPRNLRLHEQLFSCRSGPYKVRLQKLWECLARPIMERLLTGECDMQPLPDSATEEQVLEHSREAEVRRRDQKSFLKQWLLDTKGPRPSDSWTYDNREAYHEDMKNVIALQLAKFREVLDDRFYTMQQKRRGDDLAARGYIEEVNSAFNSQLQAHPMPLWLQESDVAGAFEALRRVGAAGMGGDDETAVLAFVDLVLTNQDFDCGKAFWSNVYALWLTAYAQMAQATFARKMTEIIERYNQENAEKDPDLHADLRVVPPKSYERIRAKATSSSDPAQYGTYRHRTAAASVLDVVRCSITVKEPRAALMLLDHVFEPLSLVQNRMECLRIVNRYSQSYTNDAWLGYRNIEINVLLDAGVLPSACGRQACSMHVKIIGEVQIILEDFLAIRRSRHLLFKCSRGEFDWSSSKEEEEKLGRRSTVKAMDAISGEDMEVATSV
mmetsp:Transcript_106231/g.307469  ORF Transcript_106231/g.307469 Transcript_106231/m.307469 type:complete len:895 (-) Transcript_106231:210-2894(-)